MLGSEDFGSYLCKLDEIPKYPGFKKSLDPLLRTMTCFELCNFTGAHHYIHNNHIAANCNGFHAQFIRRSIDSAHLQIKIFASGVGILNLVSCSPDPKTNSKTTNPEISLILIKIRYSFTRNNSKTYKTCSSWSKKL